MKKLFLRFYIVGTTLICCYIIATVASDATSFANESSQVTPQLIITAGEIQAFERSERIAIPIYLDNFADAVAGFTIVLESSRPDLLTFRGGGTDSVFQTLYWVCLTQNESACTDSQLVDGTQLPFDFVTYEFLGVTDGGFDVTGTLIENWQFVVSNDVAGESSRIKIIALADVLGPPTGPDLAPQSGGLLINILAEATDLPVDSPLVTVDLSISTDPSETGFSDPVGNSLTIQTDSTLDTTYWRCLEFDSTEMTCLAYEPIIEPPYEPYDTLTESWALVASWDSAYALALDGFVNIVDHCCETPGDANHDGRLSIADITFEIQYLFASGPAPTCLDEAEVNGDGRFSIADITYGIGRIFSGGPEPACGTSGS